MLNGRRIGIIGCGRIGTWMSRYAQAFGMDVVGYDPLIDEYPPGISPVSLEELARTSDFITVHVPLTEDTTGLFSKKHCEMVKQGAILINTARGAIVDEAGLLNALETKQMGAAGLDVLGGRFR